MSLSQKDIARIPPIYRIGDADKETNDTVNALIYGGSGDGKTAFIGTAGDRNLIINIGNGLKTLESPWFTQTHGYRPLVVDLSEKLEHYGLPSKAEAFDIVGDTIDHYIATRGDDFDSVTVDDATELRRFALFKGVEINQREGKSQTFANSKENQVVAPAIQDYGVEMNIIEQFIAAYTVICRQNKKNFILTAHHRLIYEKPKNNKGVVIIGAPSILKKVMPGFTGEKFPDDVPKAFDWVFHMESVAGGRNGSIFRARTQPDEVYTAKCRDGGVFDKMESDPHFLKMLQRVKDAKATANMARK